MLRLDSWKAFERMGGSHYFYLSRLFWFFVKFGGTSSIVNKESWLSVVYFLPYCTSAFLAL